MVSCPICENVIGYLTDENSSGQALPKVVLDLLHHARKLSLEDFKQRSIMADRRDAAVALRCVFDNVDKGAWMEQTLDGVDVSAHTLFKALHSYFKAQWWQCLTNPEQLRSPLLGCVDTAVMEGLRSVEDKDNRPTR